MHKIISLLTATVIITSLTGCGDTKVVIENDQVSSKTNNTNANESAQKSDISDGWHVIDGKTYYYKNNSKVIGWFKDDNGAQHYASNDGILVTDRVVDQKHLDKNGFVKKITTDSVAQNGSNFTYKTYTNTKFDFSIDYPSFYKICTSNDDEDEVMLSADEGNSTEFIVSGFNTTKYKTAEECYKDACSFIGDGVTNVYKQPLNNGFVISYDYYDEYVKKEFVYYECVMFKDGTENMFSIIYPKSEGKFYDDIITHIYHSFKTPGLGVSHP